MNQSNDEMKRAMSANHTPAPAKVIAMPARKRILSAKRRSERAMLVIVGFLVTAVGWFMAISVYLVFTLRILGPLPEIIQ